MNLCYIYFITILIVTISSSQCYWVSSLRSSQKLQRGRIGRSSSGIVLEMTADSMHSNTNSVPKSVTGLSSRQSILNIVKSSLIVSSATVLTSLSTARVQDASAAPMEGSIAVIGSSGKTGKLVVESLAKLGLPVRPIYREIPSKNIFEGVSSVENPVAADVTKPESLLEALKGSSAVIFAASASRKGGRAEQVDYIGVKNVAEAAVRLKIPRLVVISSAAVTKPDSLGYKITNIFDRIMEYKIMGEKALFDAYNNAGDKSLGYAIVRPGGLKDGKPIGAASLTLNQGDTIVGEVNRSDVANVAVAAAISKTIPNDVVFEVYESGGGSPLEGRFPGQSGYERDGRVLGGDYEVLLGGLKPGVNGL